MRLLSSVLMAALTAFGQEPVPSLPNRPPETAPTQSPKEGVPKSHFVFFKPGYNVPIIRGNRVVAYIGMNIALESANEANAKKIEETLPVLRDKILVDFYIMMDLAWKADFSPNIHSVKKRIQHACDSLLEKGLVTDILVQNFYYKKNSL